MINPPNPSEQSPIPPAPTDLPPGPPEAEVVAGQKPYLDVLAEIHRTFEPALYVEIGVRNGLSLSLSRSRSIGIDPSMEITHELGDNVTLYPMTSDEFFASPAAHGIRGVRRTFAFIDGMHLFEYALRDFLNLEHILGPGSLIAVDDVSPNHAMQATRGRQTRVWTGDVWKLPWTLREHRPDLTILILDTSPTGLMLVAGSDPTGSDGAKLTENLAEDLRPPSEVVEREGSIDPDDPVVGQLIGILVSHSGTSSTHGQVRDALATIGQ